LNRLFALEGCDLGFTMVCGVIASCNLYKHRRLILDLTETLMTSHNAEG
jgi:hypothetical protein